MKKFFFSFYLICTVLVSLQAQEAAVSSLCEPLLTDPGSLAISPDARPEIESQVFYLINQYRESQSLPPLKWSSAPSHCARQHSLDMARGVVPFCHDGFAQRVNQIKAAIPSLTRIGESVAANAGFSNPAQVAVDSWLASPGHLSNITGDYNVSGVGVGVNSRGEYYFTQIFVKANTQSREREEVSFETCVYNPPVQLEVE